MMLHRLLWQVAQVVVVFTVDLEIYAAVSDRSCREPV